MKRKSPIRHRVKQHKREGKIVYSYMRGKYKPKLIVFRRKGIGYNEKTVDPREVVGLDPTNLIKCPNCGKMTLAPQKYTYQGRPYEIKYCGHCGELLPTGLGYKAEKVVDPWAERMTNTRKMDWYKEKWKWFLERSPEYVEWYRGYPQKYGRRDRR